MSNVARKILSKLYPNLGARSIELADDVLKRYNLERLDHAEMAFLAAAIGTLAEKLEQAEGGELEIDEQISKVVETVLRGKR